MGFFDGIGGLGGAALGLGALGDAFGAYSQYQQAQRQQQLYQQAQQQAAQMRDPNYMIGQAQPYYQANMAQLRQALPQLERSSINPEIAMRGISGGAAQGVRDQIIAQQQQQAWQQALQQATGNFQGGLNALQTAGGNIGNSAGGIGGTANALQSLMFMRAMQGNRSPGIATPLSVGNSDLEAQGFSNPYMEDPSFTDRGTMTAPTGLGAFSLTPTGAGGQL